MLPSTILARQARFKTYDLAILGGGPGGYVASIKAAQNGLSVACVEARPALGGTCLNVGCIPTKALLNMTHKLHEAQSTVSKFTSVPVRADADWTKMQRQKDQVVSGLTKGIEFLFKKNKIDYVRARGKLEGPQAIRTDAALIEAKNVILATGSVSSPMPGGILPIDEKRVFSSSGILSIPSVPKKLLIVGGGAIGLEFAAMFSRLGTKVEVIEFMPQIAQGFDADVAQQLQKVLQKSGISFHLAHKVIAADTQGSAGVKITAEKPDKAQKTFEGDCVLVSVGRRPNSRDIGLEAVGIKTDRVGRVEVDEEFRSRDVPAVRAIGDLVPGPMLAHKAEEDGCAAVASILGHREKVDYSECPAVIYTAPELAMVGLSEAQLKQEKKAYRVGMFPLAANSRARANMDSDGFVKILACAQSGHILGATVMAANAGELIQLLVLAKKFGIKATELGDTIFPHPTVSEAVKEAALAAGYGKAVHM